MRQPRPQNFYVKANKPAGRQARAYDECQQRSATRESRIVDGRKERGAPTSGTPLPPPPFRIPSGALYRYISTKAIHTPTLGPTLPLARLRHQSPHAHETEKMVVKELNSWLDLWMGGKKHLQRATAKPTVSLTSRPPKKGKCRPGRSQGSTTRCRGRGSRRQGRCKGRGTTSSGRPCSPGTGRPRTSPTWRRAVVRCA